MNIEILDCTLRDGGYVNNWNFGFENISKIISKLIKSKIEYIECGFLKDCIYDENKTIFNSIEKLNGFNSFNKTLMVNYGEISVEQIPENKSNNVFLRVVFKKEQRFEALDFIEKLILKGYKVFINPMNTIDYSSSELLEILEIANRINPYAFSIVDTNGEMKKKDVLSLFYLIDNNLNSKIKLGFHSHNSLQLSFSNAQALLEQNSKHDLIIDSTVFAMGRGAGNLRTELLVQYLNDNYLKEYDILPILKIIDENIYPIFEKRPWGYSVHYYLSATNSCHPNYATYLSKLDKFSVDEMDMILKQIDKKNKNVYDEKLIEKLCYSYLNKLAQQNKKD